MPCHRCPDDDETKCSWCCPDPAIKARLIAEQDELRRRISGPRTHVPIAILCDAVRLLEERGARFEDLPAAIRAAVAEHREAEAATRSKDDDGIDPIFDMHRARAR